MLKDEIIPLLEVGKIYVNVREKYSKIFHVESVNIHSPYSISYFVTSVNTLSNMENSIHDCGGYMWETRVKWDAQYNLMRVHKDMVRLATYEEALEFAMNMRGQRIRKKFGLPRHKNCIGRFND